MRLRRHSVDNGDTATVEVVKSLARRLGVSEPQIDDGLDWSRELVDALAGLGVSLIVKVDGERDREQRVTVLLSGPPLDDDFVRLDGATIGSTLSEVLCAFALEWTGS